MFTPLLIAAVLVAITMVAHADGFAQLTSRPRLVTKNEMKL